MTDNGKKKTDNDEKRLITALTNWQQDKIDNTNAKEGDDINDDLNHCHYQIQGNNTSIVNIIIAL